VSALSARSVSLSSVSTLTDSFGLPSALDSSWLHRPQPITCRCVRVIDDLEPRVDERPNVLTSLLRREPLQGCHPTQAGPRLVSVLRDPALEGTRVKQSDRQVGGIGIWLDARLTREPRKFVTVLPHERSALLPLVPS
jgi:hypothetical protein